MRRPGHLHWQARILKCYSLSSHTSSANNSLLLAVWIWISSLSPNLSELYCLTTEMWLFKSIAVSTIPLTNTSTQWNSISPFWSISPAAKVKRAVCHAANFAVSPPPGATRMCRRSWKDSASSAPGLLHSTAEPVMLKIKGHCLQQVFLLEQAHRKHWTFKQKSY